MLLFLASWLPHCLLPIVGNSLTALSPRAKLSGGGASSQEKGSAMRRLLLILASLLLLGLVSPARACLNDSEVNKAEREFKSSYDFKADKEQPAIESPSPGEGRGRELTFGGVGATLLLAAAVVTTRKITQR